MKKEKNKKNTKRIKIPIYEDSVILSNDKKLLNEVYKDISNEVEGVVIDNSVEVFIFIFDKSHNTIAHEIYHAVCRISEKHGLECEESKAYLIGFLTKKVYKILEV